MEFLDNIKDFLSNEYELPGGLKVSGYVVFGILLFILIILFLFTRNKGSGNKSETFSDSEINPDTIEPINEPIEPLAPIEALPIENDFQQQIDDLYSLIGDTFDDLSSQLGNAQDYSYIPEVYTEEYANPFGDYGVMPDYFEYQTYNDPIYPSFAEPSPQSNYGNPVKTKTVKDQVMGKAGSAALAGALSKPITSGKAAGSGQLGKSNVNLFTNLFGSGGNKPNAGISAISGSNKPIVTGKPKGMGNLGNSNIGIFSNIFGGSKKKVNLVNQTNPVNAGSAGSAFLGGFSAPKLSPSGGFNALYSIAKGSTKGQVQNAQSNNAIVPKPKSVKPKITQKKKGK